MKLILVDGTTLVVGDCVNTKATVNGNTVDAVNITVKDRTLEAVSNIFGNSDNLSNMNLYSDENEHIATLLGYQVRVATAIVDEANEIFTVTMAKTSEVNERIEAIELEIKSISTNMKSFTKTVTSLSESFATVTKAVEGFSENVATFNNTVGNIDETYNIQSMTLEALKKEASDHEEIINAMQKTLTHVSETFDSINSAYSNLLQDIAETKKFSGQAYNATDQMQLKVEDAISRVKTANEAVESQNQEISTLKTAADDVQRAHKELSTKFAEEQEKTNTTAKTVEELNSAQQTLSTATEAVVKRVDALEPVTNYTELSLEEAKKFRIVESEKALADYLEEHPIESTCHGGVSAKYSITKDKQQYLQAMILTTQMAAQAGVEYQPSWNSTGNPCTYDWTLEELQQLAFEIEAVVRPLVSKQQAIETDITNATSMEALKAVVVSYGI